MYVASPKRIRHQGLYYDTAHEAICLEALRRVGISASKASHPSDTITDDDGRPEWLPDLVMAVPNWIGLPAGSPTTAYVECKDWPRKWGNPVPDEVMTKLRKTAAYGVVPIVVLPRKPVAVGNFAWWGWILKPGKSWEDLRFLGTDILDAYAEASQIVVPAKRWRRWEAREQLKLPLRRRESAPARQRFRLPSLS